MGSGVTFWLGADVLESAYAGDRSVTAELPSRGDGPARRAVVELRRDLGGLIMRALIGGEFRPGAGPTRYEVPVGRAAFDNGDEATCPSRLGRPLIPGLPADFADSALAGLTADADADRLPGGRLRVDRAAYDLMGSSEAAFFQAARLLRAALAGDEPEARVARRLSELDADRAS